MWLYTCLLVKSFIVYLYQGWWEWGRKESKYSLLHEEKVCQQYHKQKPFQFPLSTFTSEQVPELSSPGFVEEIATQFKGSLKETTCLINSTKTTCLKTFPTECR